MNEEIQIDLKKIISSHYEASRVNAVEANKLTVGLSASLFTISVFFLGFIATSSKIIESIGLMSVIFILASLLSGLVSILSGIYSMLYSRLMLIKSANRHLVYADYVQKWVVQNKKSMVEEIPSDLLFDQSVDGGVMAKKYGKFQAYTLFIQILFGALVFVSSIVGLNFYLK